MKRDRLYTVNRWNKRLFPLGGQTVSPSQFNYGTGAAGLTGYMYNPSVNDPDSIQLTQANQKAYQNTLYNDYLNSSGNNWFGLSKKNNPLSKANIGTTAKVAGGAAAAMASQVGVSDRNKRGMFDVLDPIHQAAGGRETGVGNALGDAGVGLFQAGASSGNPWLMAAGAAAKIVGGGINGLFGIATDEERLKKVNEGLDYLNNYVSDAKSFDDLEGIQAIANPEGIYKGSLFRSADDKNEELLNKVIEAKTRAHRSLVNNKRNIVKDNIGYQLRRYRDEGGPIYTMDNNDNMSAINYGFMQDYLINKKQEIAAKNKMAGLTPMPSFISQNSYAIGGDLQTNGADWSDGLTTIGAGGSHEENPNQGVQMGVDSEGTPNLVEEGEVVWNDYVFSNRITLDEQAKKRLHFPRKKDITYAEAAKKIEREISERPNDPVSKAGFKAQMEQLEEEQERQKQEMEAERAKAAFEALSPEEQVAVMQQAQQEEQMAQQAAMQQPSPEEIAMAEQQQAMVPQDVLPQVGGYANGGNIYDLGGAMQYLRSKYPQIDDRTLRAFAAALDRQTNAYLIDRKTGTVSRKPNSNDYERAFNSTTKGSNLTNWDYDASSDNWVEAGVPRDIDYDFFHKRPPSSFGKKKLDEYDIKRKQYIEAANTQRPSKKKAVYRSKSGRVFDTNAEALADQRAWEAEQRKSSNDASNNQKQAQSYTDDRGWKHSTQQAAEAANERYARQSAQAKQDAAPTVQKATPAKEAVSSTPAANNNSTGNQKDSSRVSEDRSSNTDLTSNDAINVGTYRGQGNQWDVYGKPGLWQYVNNALADYDLADSPEAQQEIAQRIVDELNGVQQSYWDNIVPTLGKSVQKKDKGVGSHQELYQERTGNAGFIGIDPITGQRIDLTDQAVIKPEGHNTTDTLVGGFVDERSGPQTWLRHLGASGDNLDDVVEELRRRGIDYSPYADWTVGNGDNIRQLYRASLLNSPGTNDGIPEDATNFGDSNPYVTDVEEDVDTFIPVDENGNPVTGGTASNEKIVPVLKKEWPRYLGLFGPAAGLIMQGLGIGKPDTSGIDAALGLANRGVARANYKPISNYLTYKPLDRLFYANQLQANARATDRGIVNASGANRGTAMAGLLASGYNTNNNLGNLDRQAEEYNLAQRERVEGFNRGTNQFNAEAYNRNSQFNADAMNRNRQFAASLAMQGAAQKMSADADWTNGIYGNVAGLFKGIGDLGRENAERNMLARLVASGAIPGIKPEHAMNAGLIKYGAEGGKIKRKKSKKGLTI